MSIHSVTTTTSQSSPPTSQQKRALTRLLRDLVAFGGVAVAEIAAKPRKAPRPTQRPPRLLYRKTLTDDDLDRLCAELGADRLMAALDRWTLFSVAAE